MKEDQGSGEQMLLGRRQNARNFRDEGEKTSLCQLFSGLESKPSRLGQEKTPEEGLPDWNEIGRLPQVFEFIKRRLTALLESLRMN